MYIQCIYECTLRGRSLPYQFTCTSSITIIITELLMNVVSYVHVIAYNIVSSSILYTNLQCLLTQYFIYKLYIILIVSTAYLHVIAYSLLIQYFILHVIVSTACYFVPPLPSPLRVTVTRWPRRRVWPTPDYQYQSIYE